MDRKREDQMAPEIQRFMAQGGGSEYEVLPSIHCGLTV